MYLFVDLFLYACSWPTRRNCVGSSCSVNNGEKCFFLLLWGESCRSEIIFQEHPYHCNWSCHFFLKVDDDPVTAANIISLWYSSQIGVRINASTNGLLLPWWRRMFGMEVKAYRSNTQSHMVCWNSFDLSKLYQIYVRCT